MGGRKLSGGKADKTIVPLGTVDTKASLLSPASRFAASPEVDMMPPRSSVVVVDPLIGKSINQYDIVDYVGCGGMGMVYKAKDPSDPDKFLALKLMHPHLSALESARRMFFREIKTSARIDHPNVVTVHDFDEFNHQLYLVMDFIKGADLNNHIHQNGPVSLAQALSIAVQICDGMAAAHGNNVVHRDLKLENIILADDPSSPRVKIVDMGLAKIFDANSVQGDGVTSPGVVKGTPEYMSPEAFTGGRLDHRTDIYSIGVILYYLVCNQFPFVSKSDRNDPEGALQIGMKVLEGKFKHPIEVDPSIAKTLNNIILKALARKADDRYQTAREFRDAIVNYATAAKIPLDLPDFPIPEMPAPLVVVKHRAPRSLWLAIGVLSFALTGLLTWGHFEKPRPQPPIPAERVQEKPYNVFINTNPGGALVEMHETATDGTVWLRNVGETPIRNEFVGKQTLVISIPGYHPKYIDIDPSNNQFPDLVMQPIQK
ncbi:MAG: serine/threonine-protein kinase [Candidatus Micrarchaeota archaeon]